MPRKFFKQVFTVTVLSEEEPLSENVSLTHLDEYITDGDGSGQIDCVTEEIDAPTVARLLIEQGSEPEFFELSDTGEDLSEDA